MSQKRREGLQRASNEAADVADVEDLAHGEMVLRILDVGIVPPEAKVA
jgi:hypothetical protein